MLAPATSYEEVYRGFRWQIPDSYNIGHDVCDRHVGDPTRRALIYEDAAGQVQEYASWRSCAAPTGSPTL